jgi:hypothetical protein
VRSCGKAVAVGIFIWVGIQANLLAAEIIYALLALPLWALQAEARQRDSAPLGIRLRAPCFAGALRRDWRADTMTAKANRLAYFGCRRELSMR